MKFLRNILSALRDWLGPPKRPNVREIEFTIYFIENFPLKTTTVFKCNGSLKAISKIKEISREGWGFHVFSHEPPFVEFDAVVETPEKIFMRLQTYLNYVSAQWVPILGLGIYKTISLIISPAKLEEPSSENQPSIY